VNYGPKDIV